MRLFSPQRHTMSTTKPPLLLRIIARYSVAVVTVSACVAVRIVLEKVTTNESTPFLLLFAAVLVSSASGGLGPGLLATLLGAVASDYFFIGEIQYSLSMTLPESMQVLLFMVEGVFISVLGARLQAARRRAEQSEAENRMLEQKVLDVSDDERRRIGQDLHDGLGQHLTGVAFLSKALQQRLASKQLPEANDATKNATLVTQSIGQTRALAKGLAPVGLEDGGLDSALKQLSAATSAVFGVECNCRCDEDLELPDLAVSTHLYRIAQEAVNNAVRHGKATRVDVLVERTGRSLYLTVEDNGRGINSLSRDAVLSAASSNGSGSNNGSGSENGSGAGEGMGLQIMNFRARMIGGSLQVQQRGADGGTLVTCIAPLRK